MYEFDLKAWWQDTAGLWLLAIWAGGGIVALLTGAIGWWVLAYVICGVIVLSLDR